MWGVSRIEGSEEGGRSFLAGPVISERRMVIMVAGAKTMTPWHHDIENDASKEMTQDQACIQLETISKTLNP